jgi:hypothetical protein
LPWQVYHNIDFDNKLEFTNSIAGNDAPDTANTICHHYGIKSGKHKGNLQEYSLSQAHHPANCQAIKASL